ncbi:MULTISPECIES: hypothetical protein [unclassified Nocardiopsis]|uniref:hypothetical protein n=1 Tax=unclassified Nocardiopsis TaxID=2649073 RepID=UPI0013574A9D|nr:MULTISPECIES: hypothetical protein [unclassified Nocardiopsis]
MLEFRDRAALVQVEHTSGGELLGIVGQISRMNGLIRASRLAESSRPVGHTLDEETPLVTGDNGGDSPVMAAAGRTGLEDVTGERLNEVCERDTHGVLTCEVYSGFPDRQD